MHQKGERQWFRRVTEKEFTREQVKKCVAKLKNRKAEGADQRVNNFTKYHTGVKEFIPWWLRCIPGYGKTCTHLGGGKE